jgi:putative endonuclease
MTHRAESEKQGRKAEARVASYLRLRGYKILETRFRTAYGEVDLIARKGKTLAFIEVKQRATQKAVEDAMDWRTEQRVMTAAEIWVARNFAIMPDDFEMRFDFAAIIGVVTPVSRVRYLKNAFRPD